MANLLYSIQQTMSGPSQVSICTVVHRVVGKYTVCYEIRADAINGEQLTDAHRVYLSRHGMIPGGVCVAFTAGTSPGLPAFKLESLIYIASDENGAHPGLKPPPRPHNMYTYVQEQSKWNSKFWDGHPELIFHTAHPTIPNSMIVCLGTIVAAHGHHRIRYTIHPDSLFGFQPEDVCE